VSTRTERWSSERNVSCRTSKRCTTAHTKQIHKLQRVRTNKDLPQKQGKEHNAAICNVYKLQAVSDTTAMLGLSQRSPMTPAPSNLQSPKAYALEASKRGIIFRSSQPSTYKARPNLRPYQKECFNIPGPIAYADARNKSCEHGTKVPQPGFVIKLSILDQAYSLPTKAISKGPVVSDRCF
jgi:hypothetical protein